jgi:hypothetical protein
VPVCAHWQHRKLRKDEVIPFWSLIHGDRSWQANVAQACKTPSLPADPQIFLAELSATLPLHVPS